MIKFSFQHVHISAMTTSADLANLMIIQSKPTSQWRFRWIKGSVSIPEWDWGESFRTLALFLPLNAEVLQKLGIHFS